VDQRFTPWDAQGAARRDRPTLIALTALVLLGEAPGDQADLERRSARISCCAADSPILEDVLGRLLDAELITESADAEYEITARGRRFLADSQPGLLAMREQLAGLRRRYEGLDGARPLRPRHVLVVDDNRDIRLMVRSLAELRGWTTEEATDGDDAIERCRDSTPELVLLDHRMPGTTGVEVARRLLDSGFYGRVILYSAYMEADGLSDRAAGLGVSALPKSDLRALDALFA
jgi:CheY-like chemotaxis protein